MRDELLQYYERELAFLRQMGAEFAEKYPKIASRLVLEPDKCDDPHVERMLEAFAFLAARVHLKIDDEFPEITEALLGILYPQYLRPIPSMSVVQFQHDPEQVKLTAGFRIERGATLYSRPVSGTPCKFRTCYETTLWPIEVAAAEWKTPDRLQPALRGGDAVAVLRLELRCLPDVAFDKLEMDSLRFFLQGESNLTHALYELLCNSCVKILVRDPENPKREALALSPDALQPVGFEAEEGALPYQARAFLGYRLLQEYFAFPEKFAFLDLREMERIRHSFRNRMEILFLVSTLGRGDRRQMLEMGVSAKTFRLGCTPIVNLFEQTAEPILLNQRRHEYLVIPDVRRRHAMDVYSIDEVLAVTQESAAGVRFEPFYSFRHGGGRDKAAAFWHATRRTAGWRGDGAADVYLMLADLSGTPAHPDADALTIHLTCTNGDLPSRLPFGDEAGDFQMEGGSSVHRIIALRKPTDTLRPPTGQGLLWRLISHLSLNYLSLVEGGRDALRELLKLYNFSGSVYSDRQVEGIAGVKSRRHFARVVSDQGISFVRGTQVEIEFDEEEYVGGGVYLFASVLERFLGHYASMNSFSQLIARTRQRKEVLRQWPPRAGRKILL